MITHRVLAAILVVLTGLGEIALAGPPQAPESNGIPTRLVVTAEPHKGKPVPVIPQNEVMVYEGKIRDKVTEWVPAQGDRASLEFFILIDDSASTSVGSQFDDIRKFINGQPETTSVGVAYMQNGTARIVQNLTTDHAAAGKSLRLPLGEGGANASPYFSLRDLIKNWPKTTARRAVMMVTDGIDAYYGGGNLQDPYVDEAINDALQSGIMVSAIYTPGVGHLEHSYWQNYWGQLYLSQVADATGGEAYYIGFTGPPVSFSPYFEQMATRLLNQYWLTFRAQPRKKAGWQNIRLATEVPNVDLVSAKKVYVSPQE